MKNHFYIITMLILVLIVLGCQTGNSSYNSFISSSSTNIAVTGTVKDNSDNNIANAKITLLPVNKSVFSNSSGKFEILTPENTEFLKIEKKGFNTSTVPFDKNTTTYTLTLTKGSNNLSGLITNNNTSNPISGGTVEIKSNTSDYNVFSSKTDLSGNYTFTNIPNEEYLIKVTANQYQEYEGLITSTILTSGNYNISLTPFGLSEYNIHGNVFQEGANNPISGATVEILNMDGSSYQNQVTTTDSAGEYFFQNIPSGYYKFRFKKSNFLDYYKTVTIDEDETIPNVYLALTSGSQPIGTGTKEISFIVKDADTETPISGVIVSFKDSFYNNITDDLGSCTFEVPVSQYNIEFIKGGYITQSRIIDLEEDFTNPIEIPMIYELVGNLGNIKGQVTKSDGSNFNQEVIVRAILNTEEEISQNIEIITVANQTTGEYIFKNLQVLYDPDGKEYKYILRAETDFDGSGTLETNEVSLQIVDLEAGKTSIADIMLIAP